jgi:hypothetical protein
MAASVTGLGPDILQRMPVCHLNIHTESLKE